MPKLTIKNKYGVTPNTILCSPKLSFKAKGLWGYMQSKPDGWRFSSRRIALETKDGRESIDSGLQELEEAGLLTRKKYQLPDGTFDWEHELTEKPWTENPATEKPATENPANNKEVTTKKDKVINNKDFSWEESKQKMMAVEGSDMDIIATFLDEKKLTPKTSAELTGYIKRYRKIAKDIVPFVVNDHNKFWRAIEMCKEESQRLGYTWTLETVYKKVTKI